MNVNPLMTAQLPLMANSFKRHESDLILEARAVKAELDNSILIGNTVNNKVHHLQQVASKMIVDSQNTDPFWINSVNYVASYSRHNYVNVCKVV